MQETNDPCSYCKAITSYAVTLGTPAIGTLLFDNHPRRAFRFCEDHFRWMIQGGSEASGKLGGDEE